MIWSDSIFREPMTSSRSPSQATFGFRAKCRFMDDRTLRLYVWSTGHDES